MSSYRDRLKALREQLKADLRASANRNRQQQQQQPHSILPALKPAALRPTPHAQRVTKPAERVKRPLRELGVLRDAFCIRQNRWVTMARRFVRDVSERRKPVRVLARRGLRLALEEPAVVAGHVARGARAMTPKEAERTVKV